VDSELEQQQKDADQVEADVPQQDTGGNLLLAVSK
jgi:hypothetical protein